MAFPFGILTPPDSPGKRRRQLRESDETEGELSIETYLYRSDPFRSTTIENPWPYPLRSKQAPQQITDKIMAYRDAIWAILTDHGFSRDGTLVVHDILKPGYPGGDSAVTVLRVLYRFDSHVPPVLGAARDTIHKLLVENDIFGVDVEIVHLHLCFCPSLFAIAPEDPAVTVYQRSYRDIILSLQERIQPYWTSMCLFNVGRTKEKTTPTLVITVRPGAIADWSTLYFKIRHTLGFEKPHIAVEFLPGSLQSIPDEKRSGISVLDAITPDGRPKMGCSIGAAGEADGGTREDLSARDRSEEAFVEPPPNEYANIAWPLAEGLPELPPIADEVALEISAEDIANKLKMIKRKCSSQVGHFIRNVTSGIFDLMDKSNREAWRELYDLKAMTDQLFFADDHFHTLESGLPTIAKLINKISDQPVMVEASANLEESSECEDESGFQKLRFGLSIAREMWDVRFFADLNDFQYFADNQIGSLVTVTAASNRVQNAFANTLACYVSWRWGDRGRVLMNWLVQFIRALQGSESLPCEINIASQVVHCQH
jgi:hypothetical protein